MTTTLERRPLRQSRNTPIDRIFRNDFLDFWNDNNVETIPSINIKEDKNNYFVEMAAPGLKKEDFDVNIDGNLLTISCEKETETTNGKETGSFFRREYNYSSFSRSVTLPEFADTKGIEAKYNEGVLNLRIPKKPEAQRVTNQKIKVH